MSPTSLATPDAPPVTSHESPAPTYNVAFLAAYQAEINRRCETRGVK
jgi:hypothetical protein